MGILSWLFPNDETRLARAKSQMAKGEFESARKVLLHCHAPEAEELYAKCSTEIDRAERSGLKKALADKGFHGWKIDISVKSKKRQKEIEALLRKELAAGGVDLELPDIDQDAVKDAIARVQRKARGGDAATIRIEPIVTKKG